MTSVDKAQKIDLIGVVASALCLVHCLVTPFLFLGLFGLSAYTDSVDPVWGSLDWIFLIITLFAVVRSSKSSTRSWLPLAFWSSWALLLAHVVNEKIGWIELPELFVLIPGLALVIFHSINLRDCRCRIE